MTQPSALHPTLGAPAARQLANTTKTPPQWIGVTPRWLVSVLPWTPIEAGTYRVNKVKEGGESQIRIECSPSDGEELPSAFIDYEEHPREYTLSTVTTTIDVQTRVSDLYRSPMDQVREQLGVLIEMVKERQENEIVNNANYGLLNNIVPSQRVKPRGGAPTPDDFDDLIATVWKEPAFFLAHPKAIAAFGRECTWRGVPPHGHDVRVAVRHVARDPDHPVGQAVREQRQNQHFAHAHRRKEARRRRPFRAWASR